jgi:hypothetical protein
MPTNKDLKRLVRARMRKTGEAYTTARLHLLKRKSQPKLKSQPKPAAPSATSYAKLAGTNDATLQAKTGRNWERWVKALDRVGAAAWPHGKIASHLHEKYGVSGWWSQTVTVGYERIKGLRAVGQRRDGTFEASKSKTFTVPLQRLYRAWSDARARSKWLPGAALTVRSATRGKYLRITWSDRTSVEVGFTRKAATKSHVAVQHSKLADKTMATKMKAYWEERLRALEEVLKLPAR